MQGINNANNWTNLIEDAISKNHIKYYEYDHFYNIKEVGSGSFGKVYRANWKNSQKYLVLKSFVNVNKTSIKEIVHELKIQRDVDFYENVIRFYGITSYNKENQDDNSKEYLLVMEYADSGTLQDHLKEHFKSLNWKDKFDLAIQLAHAVSCLHDEGIMHRGLHSKNVLIHQNTIKLTDFGLSKKVDEELKSRSDSSGIIPYVDPKKFKLQKYSLSKKSDVYSIGVLLWEISSGRPPFKERLTSDSSDLIVQIQKGLREVPISDTPSAYVDLYTKCWNGEPDNRPTIHQVVTKLKELKENKINDDFRVIVDEIVNLSNKIEDNVDEEEKQNILDYFNNHNVTSQEIYNWSLNNQNYSNSIVLLGDFNYLGIEINVNKNKAFELYQTAAILGNIIAQYNLGCCYKYGKGVDKDYDKAFNIFKKSAEKSHPKGINHLGYCYKYGLGTNVNEKKAFELYKKAANLGNVFGLVNLGNCYFSGIGTSADEEMVFKLHQEATNLGNTYGMINLGSCYKTGIGTRVDKQKAFELFQKAANLGNTNGIINLGNCYRRGIGTCADEEKAFELYQKAADIGNIFGIINLGVCYQNGIGTSVNMQKAFELYQKAANLENVDGINYLGNCYRYGIGTNVDERKAFELYQKAENLGVR
ncbi:kinase-like domain-containing protein [Rhizophagus clarus]|uniref:Kinase-like domain-containing protein n=1 Tax=Rhizophagus clarus TaxID=94130 RepID=A0A8H3QPA5_9GLOM|nr:kinase-like domain-containing protein [Rhizophagus clarus]